MRLRGRPRTLRGRVTPLRGRDLTQRGDADGPVAVLLLRLCLLVLPLVVGIVNVTAIQLARVRLYDAADAAALDAADALAEEALYGGGRGPRLPLSEQGVRDRAARYLAASERPDRVSAWALAPGTGTRDGHAATVALTGTVEVPLGATLLGSVFGPVTITVVATAEARLDPAGPAPPPR